MSTIPSYDHAPADDITGAEQPDARPSPSATFAELPLDGAACPSPAASQSHDLNHRDVESLVKTFGGYVAPESYYTYDIDDAQVLEGAAGTAGERTVGPWQWLGIGEKEVFAAVDRADEGSYFDLASSVLDTTPQNMQRLFAIQEVAHKVAWGCAPEVDGPHNELIGDLAMVNAGGRTGLLISIGNAALSKNPNYSEIQSAVGQALSQSLAGFGLEVDSRQALAALQQQFLAARASGQPLAEALDNTGHQLGIEKPQLGPWQRVLQDEVQSVMQSRVNAALSH
jgi:hypothetical protein